MFLIDTVTSLQYKKDHEEKQLCSRPISSGQINWSEVHKHCVYAMETEMLFGLKDACSRILDS